MRLRLLALFISTSLAGAQLMLSRLWDTKHSKHHDSVYRWSKYQTSKLFFATDWENVFVFCCCCFFYLLPVCLLYVRVGHSVCNDNQAWQSPASNDALRVSGKEAAMDLMKTRHKRKPAPSALNIITHNVHLSTHIHTNKTDVTSHLWNPLSFLLSPHCFLWFFANVKQHEYKTYRKKKHFSPDCPYEYTMLYI